MVSDAAEDRPPEQLRYATWLDASTRLGLAVLLLGFLAYAFSWAPGHVPLERLPAVWGLHAAEFRVQTGMPRGWGWAALLQHGDMVALAGIALLAGCSVACLLALLPLYVRNREPAYVALVLLEVAVIALAASGVLSAGH